MACKSCAERRARMKAWLKERFRVEEIHRKAKQQAGRTGAEHQQQAVEAVEAAGAGEGSVPVPSVQEDGDRA